jgi:hypothetical protein
MSGSNKNLGLGHCLSRMVGVFFTVLRVDKKNISIELAFQSDVKTVKFSSVASFQMQKI